MVSNNLTARSILRIGGLSKQDFVAEMLIYFAFKCKHRDGAMVEFDPDGGLPTILQKRIG
jgi:hypothetical protein